MPLNEDRGIHARQTGRIVPLAVGAGVLIHMGAIVAVTAAGWAVPASDADGHTVIGVAQERLDNTNGGNGARTVRVQKGVFGIVASDANPVTQAHVGRPVYVEDDGAVAGAGMTHSVPAGVVDELGDGLVYVYFA